jgi:hypothetical protein
MDKEQSGEFGVNLGPNCHQEISMACLKIMNSQLRFNICGLKTSFALNSEAEDLSERVKECISPGLHYACLTGGYHLQNALPIASEVDSVAAVHQVMSFPSDCPFELTSFFHNTGYHHWCDIFLGE